MDVRLGRDKYHTHNMKCVMKLLIHSPNSTVQPLKFGNGYVISSYTYLGVWLLTNAGIKVSPYHI